MGAYNRSNTSRIPYRLPEPIYCDPADIGDRIELAMIDKYIRIHEGMLRRYEYLEELYKGFHDVYRQPEKADWKPDWRLVVNFPRYISETFAGYGYSIPIKITHDDEAVTESVTEFIKYNEFHDCVAELVHYCTMYGHAWAFMYQDEAARTNVSAVTPKELFCVYDDTMKKRALFAVRYGRHRSGRNKGKLYGTVMTPEYIRSFDAGRFTEDEVVNQYRRIPVVEWVLNTDRMGLYEPVTGLVENFDHTLSEKGNDVDAFAEAVLAIIGPRLNINQLEGEEMRDKRVMNLYGDDVKDAIVQYLARPSADDTQEHHLDRLERLIYQIAMVANISDESFGNATSGAALAYKLWSTSNVVSTFNRKIEKSLQKMFKLWCSFATNTTNENAWNEMKFTFTTNMPRNRAEETATAQQASGLVSRRTQLGLLSYVDDPDAEMEQIRKEQEDELAGYDMDAGDPYAQNSGRSREKEE